LQSFVVLWESSRLFEVYKTAMQNNKRFWFWLLAIPAERCWPASLGNWLQAWLAYTVLPAIRALLQRLAASAAGEYLAPAITALSCAWPLAALLLMLPVRLCEQRRTQAGYMFTDAYIRDNQAWGGHFHRPISDAFSGNYSGDQYGGLLALSAAVYRYISPAAHHPLLIVILGAAARLRHAPLGKASQAWFVPPCSSH
jgi:hypothetical protein